MLRKVKIVLLFSCFSLFAFAQQITVTVTGKVTEAGNIPMVGVGISVEGTTTGTFTDINGKYSITVKDSESVLVFSYLGYKAQKIKVNTQKEINVQMESSSVQLSDVVIIGYGTIPKKDLTGAIQSISGLDIEKSLNSDITESLNGKISGVLVKKTSNRPGSDMSVEIRGINSINSSNEPLYVIDGIPAYSGMKFLNSSDIESIDILKDASSSAIYGSRGANGVVIITTKGARKTAGFNIEYTGSEGIKYPTHIPDMIGNMGNGAEYVNYRINLWTKKYGSSSLSRSDFLTDAEKKRIKNGVYYDWLRELSDPSFTSSHSINSSGGNDTTSYTFGIGYLNENGMIGSEGFERITANVGLEHRISKKMKTGINAYLSRTNTDHGSDNALLNAYLIPPIESPYDDDGNLVFEVQPTSSKINPLVQVQNDINQTEAYYVNASSFIEYSPFSDLTIKSMIAYQFDSDISGEWVGEYTQQNSGINPAYASRTDGRNINWVWDNTVTYKKKFNDENRLEAIGLFSMQKDEHQGSSMTGSGLPYESLWYAIQTAEDITNVSSYYWESAMQSFMLRANYTWKERYMLTLTGRYDGTSRLAEGNQWGFMPSAALGWQVASEEFMQNLDFINNMKLRLSYGKTGNNNLSYDIAISSLNLSKYSFGGTGFNGFGIGSTKGNSDLTWEMTSEYNLGLDLGFFKNKISATIDVYSRKTEGLIFNRSISAVNGYTSIYQNIGTTSNKGVEFNLNTVNISTKDFKWTSRVTFSLNRNKIVDLYGDKTDDLGNRWFIGQSINAVYNYKQIGIWQEDEADEAASYGQSVGHIHVEDKYQDGIIDEKDYQIIGTSDPDWTAGFNTSFYYKQFDLSIDGYIRYGGLYQDDFTYMFTGWDNEHWNKLDVAYWTAENRANKYPQVGAQSYYTQVLAYIPGTYLKIQNITLAYSLPDRLSKRLKLNNARISGTVQNPLTLSEYLGSDPEVIGENVYTGMSLYPMTFSLGLKINF